MNKLANIFLASILLTSPVFAKSGGEDSNTGCNGVGNSNSPCNPTATTTGNTTFNNSIGLENTVYSSNTLVNSNSSYSNASSSARSTSDSSSVSGSSVTNNNTMVGSSGGGTTVNSEINIPRQAPSAIAPNMSASGNNSVSGGISTPFGGVSFGSSTVDSSVRQLNRATADKIYVDTFLNIQECKTDECAVIKKFILRRFK